MTLHVRILPEAEAQAEALAAWWREHRPAAPELVKEELLRAVTVLAETPFVGSPYTRTRIPDVRRFPLRKTPYHVYYRVKEAAGEVVIMSVWSAMRKRGPPLGR